MLKVAESGIAVFASTRLAFSPAQRVIPTVPAEVSSSGVVTSVVKPRAVVPRITCEDAKGDPSGEEIRM